MKFRSTLFGGLTTAVLISAASVATAEIAAKNVPDVMKAMQDFGLVVTLEKDAEGDPKILGRVSDTRYAVYFYGCKDNQNCSSLLFKAGYDLERGISALKANEWNSRKRFSRAYIDDEGDPYLEMDLNLDFEGVGDKNFQDTLDWWRLLVEDFEEFIEW